MAEFPPSDTILGCWSRAPLGTLLIFLAECGMVRRLAGASALDMAVEGLASGPFQEWSNPGPGPAPSPALSLLFAMDDIRRVFSVSGKEGNRALCDAAGPGTYCHPGRDEDGFDYDTTQRIQALWRQSGIAPLLVLRPAWMEQARERLARRFSGRPVVALHLKNVTGAGPDPISLANQAVWADFLRRALQSDVAFLLLGDDPVSEEIAALPHVARGRDLGAASFAEHVALLACANGFMGMMSAFCNFALFSPLPYAIFKNPDHHRAEMIQEIGTDDHYCFAAPGQKILRVNETPELLLAELGRMRLVEGVAG